MLHNIKWYGFIPWLFLCVCVLRFQQSIRDRCICLAWLLHMGW